MEQVIGSLRRLFDESEEAIICVSLNGRLIYYNEKGEKFLRKNYFSKTEFYYEEIQEETSNSSIYKKIYSKNTNNQHVNVLASIQTLKHLNMKVIFFEQAEVSEIVTPPFEESYENLMNLFNKMDYPILISNEKGEILGYNESAVRFTNNELLVQKTYDAFINEFKFEKAEIIKFYKGIGNKNYGEILLKKDIANEIRTYRLMALYYLERKLLITIIKESDNAFPLPLPQLNEKALNFLGESTAKILHEINNPLTILKGYIKLLINSSSQNVTYYKVIDQELTKIMNLTTDLLYLSKPKKDKYERVCLITAIKECILLFEHAILNSKCRIELIYNELEEYMIYGNRERLKQIIINLLKNALEAMVVNEKEGLIKINLMLNYNKCLIIVQDNGIGIEESKMQQLFQPFFTTKDLGTGLGLSITKQLVEEHRGKIKVESRLGKGTRFTIELPARRSLLEGSPLLTV